MLDPINITDVREMNNHTLEGMKVSYVTCILLCKSLSSNSIQFVFTRKKIIFVVMLTEHNVKMLKPT